MYCSHWHNTPEKNRTYERDDDDAQVHRRFCSQTKRFVSERDECTEHYKASSIFWCKKEEKWMNVLACLARRTSANTCIWGCGQRDDILEVLRALDNDEPTHKESRLIK